MKPIAFLLVLFLSSFRAYAGTIQDILTYSYGDSKYLDKVAGSLKSVDITSGEADLAPGNSFTFPNYYRIFTKKPTHVTFTARFIINDSGDIDSNSVDADFNFDNPINITKSDRDVAFGVTHLHYPNDKFPKFSFDFMDNLFYWCRQLVTDESLKEFLTDVSINTATIKLKPNAPISVTTDNANFSADFVVGQDSEISIEKTTKLYKLPNSTEKKLGFDATCRLNLNTTWGRIAFSNVGLCFGKGEAHMTVHASRESKDDMMFTVDTDDARGNNLSVENVCSWAYGTPYSELRADALGVTLSKWKLSTHQKHDFDMNGDYICEFGNPHYSVRKANGSVDTASVVGSLTAEIPYTYGSTDSSLFPIGIKIEAGSKLYSVGDIPKYALAQTIKTNYIAAASSINTLRKPVLIASNSYNSKNGK